MITIVIANGSLDQSSTGALDDHSGHPVCGHLWLISQRAQARASVIEHQREHTMATENTQDTQTRPAAERQSGKGQAAGQGGAQLGNQHEHERPVRTSREQGQGLATRQRSAGTSIQSGAGSLTPFSFMRQLSDDMDRLFSNFGLGSVVTPMGGTRRDLWLEPLSTAATLWSPQVDLFQRGEELVVRADLPGLSKEEISIDVDGDVLTIRGERQKESKDEHDGYYWNERNYGAFQRSIPLPEGAKGDDAKAEFRDGVLEVMIPTPQQAKRRGRSIQIR